MTFDQIVDKLATENAASKMEHGFWLHLAQQTQADAIRNEFCEWYGAYALGDITGPHGELAELIDLMNVCARRIMFLTGEREA